MNTHILNTKSAVAVLFFLVLVFILWNFFTKENSESLARTKHAQLAINLLTKEIDKYEEQHGHYPNEKKWFIELTNNGQISGFLGRIPVKNNEPIDPWGYPYRYSNPGKHNVDKYDLYTYGADFSPGGKGENGDITNWK